MKDFTIDYVADSLEHPRGAREVGWHVTDLIRASDDMVKGRDIDPMAYWYDETRPDLDMSRTPGILDMGRIWEALSIRALNEWAADRGMVVNQLDRALNLDGVWMSLDGVLETNLPGAVPLEWPVAVVECKFRFANIDDPRSSTPWVKWMRQVKSYCHVVGVKHAWMVVGSVTSRPPSAASKIEIVEFSREELLANWQMIMNTKKYLEGLYMDIPPGTKEMPW